MANAHRGLLARVPLWLRISTIIALVLVGVVVGAKLLGGTAIADRGGDHAPAPGNDAPRFPEGHTPPAGRGH